MFSKKELAIKSFVQIPFFLRSTLNTLPSIKLDGFWILRYTFDSRNKTFYRGIWKTKNNISMIVFLSESAMEELQKLDMIEIMMDGTFRILPRHMKFSQLYIMSFTYKERAYPFGFIFMEKRDTKSYDCLFSNLIRLWNVNVAFKVLKIMTDYERAVRNSVRKHFPNARISG